MKRLNKNFVNSLTGNVGNIFDPSVDGKEKRRVSFKLIPFIDDKENSMINDFFEYAPNKSNMESTRALKQYYSYVQLISDTEKSNTIKQFDIVVMKLPNKLITMMKNSYIDFYDLYNSTIITMDIENKIINNGMKDESFRDHFFYFSDFKYPFTTKEVSFDIYDDEISEFVDATIKNYQTKDFLNLQQRYEEDSLKEYRFKKRNVIDLTQKAKMFSINSVNSFEGFMNREKSMYVDEIEKTFLLRLNQKEILGYINEKLIGSEESDISEIFQLDEQYYIFKTVRKGVVKYHTLDSHNQRILMYNSDTRQEQVLVTIGFKNEGVNAQQFAKYAGRMLN